MADLHDLAPFYALGALSDDERVAFETHLTSCALCIAELDDSDSGVGVLARWAAEPAPSEMKATVMDRIDRLVPVEAPPGSFDEADNVVPLFRKVAPALVAVAAALALIFGIGLVTDGDQARIDSIIAAEDSVTIEFAPTVADTAEIIYSTDGEAVFSVSGLSQVHETETYQLWLIGSDGPTSAGVFRPAADGSALVLLDHSVSPGLFLGLTVEPAGGSPAPTGEILMSGEI